MAFLHEQPDEDTQVEDHILAELERELCRLPDVTAARIVADGAHRPVEVHILARPGKPAKQLVRDVQSVALASFGIELDRRIVSVVQLGENGKSGSRADDDGADDGDVARDFRPRIATINSESNGLRSLVRVTLAHDGIEAIGFSEGSSSTASLVAAATIDALRQIEPVAECIDLDSAQIVRVGVHDVAVVTAVFVVPPAAEIVVGSAFVRQNQEAEAIARAVLDATNRRLTQLR
ncbi:MAG TPA: hypothetical protein VF441_05355 [Acidimicrobiia bacterium]